MTSPTSIARACVAVVTALAASAGFVVADAAASTVHADANPIEIVLENAGATRPAVRLARPGTVFFPLKVVKGCAVLDNFADARSGGRVHEGEDIISPLGTEIYAVVDGTLTRQSINGDPGTALSGNAWTLTAATGKTYYFYAHLSAFATGLTLGSKVKQGDVMGYVGDTGNPGPGNYHLHFEIHPNGLAAVDPLPLLTVPFGCTVY